MKTIPYLEDLPRHQAPRVGRVCPRCRGSIVTFYADEAPCCMSCGFVPVVTRSASDRIAYQQGLETQELMSNDVKRGPRIAGTYESRVPSTRQYQIQQARARYNAKKAAS